MGIPIVHNIDSEMNIGPEPYGIYTNDIVGHDHNIMGPHANKQLKQPSN